MVKSGENVRGFFKQFCEAPIGSSNNQALGKLRDLGVSTLDTIKSSKTGLPTGKAEAWRHTNLRNLFPSERYYGGATTNINKARTDSFYAAASAKIDEFIHDECEGSCVVYVNGVYSERLSRLDKIPGNVLLETFSAGTVTTGSRSSGSGSGGSSLCSDAEMDKCMGIVPDATELGRDSFSSDSLTAVNMANCVDACLIRVPSGEHVDTPLHIVHFCSERESSNMEGEVVGGGGGVAAVFPRLAIDMQQGSSLRIKQSYISDSSGNDGGTTPADGVSDAMLIVGVTDAQLAEGARLSHSYEQELPGSYRVMEVVNTEMWGGVSAYDLTVLQSGAKLARVNAHVNMHEPHTNCSLNSVHLSHKRQSHDLHSSIVHLAPECRSSQQHRNVIGSRGESIFKGRIRIPKIAQKTDSDQLCRSLMLGEKARVVAMPTLEITADDVVCSHGASVADLDENSLFYLAARGVNRREARKLLLRGFSLEVLEEAGMIDKKAAERVIVKTDMMAPDGGRTLGQSMVSM
jgi:Fe-S cluster assembly protein SufD